MEWGLHWTRYMGEESRLEPMQLATVVEEAKHVNHEQAISLELTIVFLEKAKLTLLFPFNTCVSFT